jgi:hypothetical protein
MNSQIELCAIINQLLSESDDPRIQDLSMDNDHNDGEIILTFDGIEFIIKPKEFED